MARGRGDEPSDASPYGGSEPPTPWVETRAGGLFFLNCVLVAPVAIVLFPLTVGGTLRFFGLLHGPSPLWDPVPLVAGQMARWLGWLAAVPLALAARNLAIVDRPGPRVALVAFILAHLGVLCWTAAQWIG